MEIFIKFINFLNEKFAASMVYIGEHIPAIIKYFTHKIFEYIKSFYNFLKAKQNKLINWIYSPQKKRKAAPPNYNKFISNLFSPITISIAILVSTIVFFHDQAARLGEKRPMDDVVKEMKELKGLRKPAFFKFKDREFSVDDIYFPIYIKSTNSIKRLILEINLRASNRYIKTFFTENNMRNLDLIYDRLNLTTEQIIPHFPLTDEGKFIIKRKIKIELDILLRDIGIKGEIEKVFISQIIGA